jgi:FkbM family methyltransferase
MFDRLRLIRDRVYVLTFKSRVVSHKYGGIPLTLQICDPMAKLWYDKDWDELPEITFLKKLKLRPGAKVFELGAHQGQMALLLANVVAPRGTVIALEPSNYNFKIANKNAELNHATNITFINAAVAESDGKLHFNNCLNGRVGSGPEVSSFCIDSLCRQYGEPDVIFLDVEGYEFNVLQGARKLLTGNADWFVEVHSGCGLESLGASSADVVEMFRSRGYSLFVQTDEHYQQQFCEMHAMPTHRFFLIATRGLSNSRCNKLVGSDVSAPRARPPVCS